MSRPTPDPIPVTELLQRLAGARETLAAVPVGRLAELLGRVARRFAEPGDPVRDSALRQLPSAADLSPGMARAVLDGMARDWSAERMSGLLEHCFEEPTCLDRPVEVRGRRTMAFGPRLCVQIVSGGVPGVGVNAALRSLLVKAPTLIKPGAGDELLTRLFAEALREEDPGLGRALAVSYWPGEEPERTREAVARAEVVVAYGSDESVAAVRSLVPVTTRFVGYHHRFGIGLVGRDVPAGAMAGVAEAAARAVSMFEHRGCVCPHVLYVEEGGERVPEAFAEALARALGELAELWPAPEPSPSEASRRAQARGTVELAEAAGAVRLMRGDGADWHVLFDAGLADLPLIPGRSVRVRPVRDLAEVPGMLGASAAHLQSVGYAGVGDRLEDLAAAFGRAGASRLTPLERMSFPPAWWIHDGRNPLEPLVRWVEVE